MISKLVTLACTAFFIVSAQAGVFSIAPLGSRTAAQPGRSISETYTLTNPGTEVLSVEVAMHDWKQANNGEFELTPSSDFTIYPKVVRIPAGESKTVRIIRRATASAISKEALYRIEFRELVPQKELAENTFALNVVTKITAPFVVMAQGLTPENKFEFTADAVKNTGETLVKFSSISCGDKPVRGLTYVLPSRQVPLTSCPSSFTFVQEPSAN